MPSEARLIKYISTYTCNKTPTFLWFDAELAAGDYRSRKSITAGGFQPGVNSRFRYLLKNEYNSRCASGTSSATSRLSNHNVPPGSSENPYGEARSAEFDGTGGRVDRWTGGRVDGLDGPEKCPLNFFILCGYIDYVYVYLYTK